jgi:hypothetical protein
VGVGTTDVGDLWSKPLRWAQAAWCSNKKSWRLVYAFK